MQFRWNWPVSFSDRRHCTCGNLMAHSIHVLVVSPRALQAMASSPLAYSCSRDSASSQAASNDNAVDARLRPCCSSCFAGPSLNPRVNYALCPPLVIAYNHKKKFPQLIRRMVTPILLSQNIKNSIFSVLIF